MTKDEERTNDAGPIDAGPFVHDRPGPVGDERVMVPVREQWFLSVVGQLDAVFLGIDDFRGVGADVVLDAVTDAGGVCAAFFREG